MFQKGSDRAFVERLTVMACGKAERGQVVVDRVDGPSNAVCDWSNHSVELCINDEDSRHDGRGNHQSENDYGIAGAIQQRLAEADYSDGRHSPAGADREGARAISNSVIDQVTTERNRRQLSDFVWELGQLIDHDIVATEAAKVVADPIPADDFFLNDPDIEFCDEDPNELQPDGTYSDETARFTAANHFTFTRSAGFTDANGVRQHRNGITSFLDASVVYGSDLETANNLRSFAGGKLKIESNGLLPTSDQREGQGFVAGDHRSTENPLLSSLQTLWVREHNRICDQLSAQQPGLSDERLYQKARVKVMGLLQHITYNEFLPAVLGDDALTDNKGYDAEVNPGIFNEFAAAAYRFGHSMISDTVAQRDHDGSESASGDITLKDAFFNIQVLQQSGIDTVLRGASLQQAQEVDTQYVDGLRNFLFSAPPEGSKCPMRGMLRFTNGVFPGLDLGSRNIQRGRDHGLDSYNDIRETLGLKRLETFEEITSDQDLAQRLKELYNNDINNVDLYVAGLAEDHVEGSSLGEVFGTIIKRQFEAIRDGDRFWHENEENKLFSEAELAEIKGTKLSDVIERNTEITGLRDNVFLLNIKGTAGDDLLNGTHLADQFCASMGHDRIDGGESFDTIDYTTLEGPITLRFDGVLKGSNSLDDLGIAAMEELQELASKGNHEQIFYSPALLWSVGQWLFNKAKATAEQGRCGCCRWLRTWL